MDLSEAVLVVPDALAVLVGLLMTAAVVVLGLMAAQRRRLTKRFAGLAADVALTEDVTGLGSWSRGIDDATARWSPGLYKLFGVDPKTFTPTREAILSLVHPDDRPAFARIASPDASGGQGGDAELRLFCGDGAVKDVLVVVRFRKSPDGTVKEVTGIVFDITARKAAQRMVVLREEQLRLAMDAMGAGVWEVDLLTKTRSVGEQWVKILGHDPKTFTLTREEHDALTHPDDREVVREAYRVQIAAAKPVDIEYRMRHADGRYIWIHSRGRLLHDAGGAPVKMIGTVVEITGRKQSAARLEKRAMEATMLHEGVKIAAEASSLPAALDALINLICHTIGWPVGHVFVVAPSGGELMSTDIWHDHSPERCARLRTTKAGIKLAPGEGLPGGVWLAGRPLWVADMAGDSRLALLHDFPELHAAVAFPIAVRGDVRAVIEFFSDRVRPEDSDLVRVFETLGRQIGGIIERLEAYEELSRSRESLELAILASEAGHFDIDAKTNKAYWSPRVRQMLNIKSADFRITPEVLVRDVHPDDQPEFLADLEEHYQRNTPLNVEVRVKPPTGNAIWVHIRAVRQLDPAGRAVRSVGFIRDISAQKIAERALSESERKFRGLIEGSIQGLVIHRRHKPLFCNLAFARQLGYERVEDVLELPSLLVHRAPEDKVDADDVWRRALAGEFAGKVREVVTIDRLGRRRHQETLWHMIEWEGAPACQMIVMDVTERKERERELAAARDRLKAQADELAALARNLTFERERAENASAAKSQFLAMISHEIRTPMTGVLGMADLLLMSEQTAEQQELTQLLIRSARALLDLLNDILDFSKIEAGQLDIESTPFRLSDVIADVKNLFGSVAAGKGLSLEARLPADYWNDVIGDPKRLRQVLSNLMSNAIKFTASGNIILGLIQERVEGGGLRLRFSVADTGIGMSPEDRERLFRPFMQADVSTARKYGGTGLGLAICKRLVAAMGGEIRAESTQGEGSVFSFSVLVGRGQLGAGAAPAPVVPVEAQAPASLAVAKSRILLAEDSETSRRLIATMLTRLGHTVETAEDGAEAVAKAKDNAYDVILMDMQMPVMDGPEAAREIRKAGGMCATTPIIALTADVIPDNHATYFAAGVDAIVAKPVDWAALAAEMIRLAQGASARGHTPPSGTEAEAPTPPNVLDEAMIDGLVETVGEEVFAPMITTFRANMAQYRDDLAAAVKAGDLRKAKRTAHALKGLCAQFGAPYASGLAKLIEVDSGSLDEVKPTLSRLVVAMAATEQALAKRFPCALNRTPALAAPEVYAAVSVPQQD